MKKSDFSQTFSDNRRWMESYYKILKKLYEDDTIMTNDDKAEIFEAFALKLCAQWEAFIQNLFIDCLNRDSSALAAYLQLKLSKHFSLDECEALLFGTRYFDFDRIGDAKRHAKRILINRFNPFKFIKSKDAKVIDELFYIRNYLSHYSGYAERKLIDQVYSKHFRTRRFVHPGKFLTTAKTGDRYIRMSYYLFSMLAAASDMRRALAPSRIRRLKAK